MSSRDEIVPIVDREDTIIDAVPRHVMRDKGLLHRVTYIFVFNAAGQLFLQKRTTTKDLYPGYYDAAAGGVLVVGESYEESAMREAEEELGIIDIPLKRCFKMFFKETNNSCWGMVYSCVSEGPFELQPEEVESGEFVNVDDVLNERVKPITPDTLLALRRLMTR